MMEILNTEDIEIPQRRVSSADKRESVVRSGFAMNLEDAKPSEGRNRI